MTTYQFSTHISASGEVSPIPNWTGGEADAVIYVVAPKENPVDPTRTMPNGKAAVEDFIEFCMKQPPSDITDEEIEQAKYDYLREKYG